MTQVANIRVNTSAPFPALVDASGPLTILKRNGVWTVGLSFAGLGVLSAGIDPSQVQILVYNLSANTFQVVTVAALQSSGQAPTIVTHVMSPYAPLPSDVLLLVDTTGGAVEIDLPAAADRNGVDLKIKDYKGNAATDNITVKPNGAETVDSSTNAAPLVLQANYDGVRLTPITAGYIIAP